LDILWFWLESDCIEIMPSQWRRHLCLCEVIKNMSYRINLAIKEKERVDREIQDNPQGREEYRGKWKTGKAYRSSLTAARDIAIDLEEYIQRKSLLLKEIVALKNIIDPNQEYFNKRVMLAKKYNAWRELFECKDKDEAEFYLDLIALEQQSSVMGEINA
jgi:hypothetical protein